MKKEIFSLLHSIINVFRRGKFLYRFIGILAFTTLITELGSIGLPEAVIPNYDQVRSDYGWGTAFLLALFVGKYANGYDTWAIIIKIIFALFCLYIEFKIHASDKGHNSIWNFFIGSQTVNQTYNFKEDD